MGMREKLIKVLFNAHNMVTDASLFDDATYAQQIEIEADYLIANGVTFDKDINALTKKVARLEKSNRNWRRKHQRLKADAVSRGYHEQVRWERDIAIEQLESYGISLGEKAYVVKLLREPIPFLKDDNPHNTDAYCPNCGTDLSGYFGGEHLPIVTCFECGEIIDPYKAMTKDELAEWRKERQ